MTRAPLRAALAFLLLLLPAVHPGAALAAPGPAADRRPPDQREVIDKVLEVLARPEFEGSDEDEEGILLMLANFLSDIVDRVKELRRTDPVVYGTIVGWLVVTLIAIVAHVAWTVWRGGASGRLRPGGGEALLDPALATRAGRDPARMLDRADGAAEAGRFGEGAAWLYLSLLFRMERAGDLEFDPARTGLEFADALARRPGPRRAWLRFLDLHDPVVFGDHPCDGAAFAALRGLATGPLPDAGGDRGAAQ